MNADGSAAVNLTNHPAQDFAPAFSPARARGRALPSEGEAAELLYREANLSTHAPAAHDLFVTIGMEAFAERARGELQATGERVRRRTVETREELTPQELQIARLARDGLSNPEIRRELSRALPSSDSELVSPPERKD